MEMNRLHELIAFLQGRTFGAAHANYVCIHADHVATVFEATAKTGKVMLPTDLILEWIQALEFGLITAEAHPRKMREIVKTHSRWAAHLHGFETHLAAIVSAWHEAHS